MHAVITDSGVGGLSVCAYAERFVRTHGFREPVRLTFVNAAPANDYGYNSMPSRGGKLQSFDSFLAIVAERYAPDVIYVACNTLSVLLADTPYARSSAMPVKGIVDTGVELVMRELDARRDAVALIFGTQTTIDAGTHARLLEARGVKASRIVAQACPGLADTISEDRDGARTKAEIAKWVGAAIENRVVAEAVACLACTHYGYRNQLFADVLAGAGIRATVVDPNERAIDDIFGIQASGTLQNCEVEVEFVTRYAVPTATVSALGHFLGAISPRTVAALQSFRHEPELF